MKIFVLLLVNVNPAQLMVPECRVSSCGLEPSIAFIPMLLVYLGHPVETLTIQKHLYQGTSRNCLGRNDVSQRRSITMLSKDSLQAQIFQAKYRTCQSVRNPAWNESIWSQIIVSLSEKNSTVLILLLKKNTNVNVSVLLLYFLTPMATVFSLMIEWSQNYILWFVWFYLYLWNQVSHHFVSYNLKTE